MLALNTDKWIGRTQTLAGCIDDNTAMMLHAIFGRPTTSAPQPHTALPALWHWAAFKPKAAMADLASDGHPKRGGFLPPINLPRRMWAGGQVSFHHAILQGIPLAQHSIIRDISHKGPELVLVTVDHEIRQDGRLALTETQNIVYLPIPDRFTPPRQKPVPQDRVFDTAVPVDQTLLFRYSAATFNAHRIHYDLPYAQTVEKYPGLVVHGPLQATLLIQAAQNHHRSKAPATFTYRGIHPMFHDNPMHLIGFDETDHGLSLCTAMPDSHQGMQATLTWKDAQ